MSLLSAATEPRVPLTFFFFLFLVQLFQRHLLAMNQANAAQQQRSVAHTCWIYFTPPAWDQMFKNPPPPSLFKESSFHFGVFSHSTSHFQHRWLVGCGRATLDTLHFLTFRQTVGNPAVEKSRGAKSRLSFSLCGAI